MKAYKFTVFILLLFCFTLLTACNKSQGVYPNLQGEKILVYVAFHEDEAKPLLEGFKQKTGCEYSILRFPTGEALARVMEEKKDPKADVFLGGTVDAHESMKREGIIEKYISKNARSISERYKDKDGYWTGLYIEALSIGINKERWNLEFKSKGIKQPESFEDLLNPAFKGEIIIPDPKTSGTGYTFVSYLVQSMGKEKALEYLGKLSRNVAQVTANGFTPAQKVGIGEYLIAVNFINQQLIVKKSGFNIESKIPKDVGWTLCAVSKIKNGPDSKAANAFIDYCLTLEAGNALKNFSMAMSTREDVSIPEGGQKLKDLLASEKYDFKKAAIDKKDMLDALEKINP
ncbi:ABC transporter substrate-binding protein [Clostridium tagluense]|uniref:ABC transporter substrate-binding protein n=1 Tax=Clostridium tagluense TaxID=360422 RepID=UPI001C0CB2CE|nr:ABC transporter substrate-binding protein [Clostridium tagluense]MBU3127603.1 ABC transporter substrate-binding protein [Clostridium tagluense]MCB2312619.1 ABC transporter substrate-binding protein [Clostridium tagluense]MCB2317295.1 ABC transporter substrate-binding protein [Clostridium tagluense]MCB2322162.1 ABC transporter substrate-binding protein [Clostridium tagluense]MCB2327091.1 ABC transporter substrate-binding protein [Clostridium tagluense]